MHVHEGTIAVELAFALGALHALEPGHGKTAMVAYLMGGKKGAAHSVVMGVVSGLSHTASILVFAFLAHLASHLLTDGHDSSQILTAVFTWTSGMLMTGIGAYLLWRARRRHASGHGHAESCSCGAAHGLPRVHLNLKLAKVDQSARESFGLSALVGMSGGLLPCPSALATYMSGMASGNTLDAVVAILIYAVGIAVCISGLGLVIHFAGERATALMRHGRYARTLAYLQAAAILGIGLLYTTKAIFGVGTPLG